MLNVQEYKAKHQLRTYWNQYAKEKQYEFVDVDIYCIYFLGILIYKKITLPK